MKMRVVGGAHDGRWVNIKEGIDYIKLIDPRPPVSVHDLEQLVKPVDIRHTTYTVRRLRWHAGVDNVEDFFYLAPEDWSDFKAIKWQFEK